MRIVVGLAIAMVALPAAAKEGEPSVRELQQAAARYGEVHPDRVRSWMKRVRLAALAPSLTVRAGRGTSELRVDSAIDGTQRFTLNAGDAWRLEASATWQLDRLVFDKEEMHLARESQRIGARREILLTEVAQIYFERKRVQLALDGMDGPERAEAELRVAELGAILDGLTGGAFSRTER